MRTLIRNAKKGFTLIELMIVVAIIGVLAVLGIYGVRKYIANAKSAEARANVGQISKGAIAAYNKEAMSGTVIAQGSSTAALRALCVTATSAVPNAMASVQGTKYQSAPSEWNKDASTNAGFACLHFVLDSPQYYQYNYVAVAGASFTATAMGDLDANGTYSTFQQFGSISNGVLNVAPTITETNPDE